MIIKMELLITKLANLKIIKIKNILWNLIKKYNRIKQLHAYSLLYSNLETDEKFLAEHSKAKMKINLKV